MTDPTTTSALDTPSHAGLHINHNAHEATLGGAHEYGTLPRLLDVRDFGTMNLDNVTDDSATIQAAIDHAQSLTLNSGNMHTVVLPAAQIAIASTLTWKSCNLVGLGPDDSTSLTWTGAAGGTMVQKWSTSHVGNTGYPMLANLGFNRFSLDAQNKPAKILDLTTNTNSPDAFLRLWNVGFSDCSGDAITLKKWTNIHWEHLRFDRVGGYAIDLIADSTTSCPSFKLDSFTYDNYSARPLDGTRPTGPYGSGFLHIDNTIAAANIGIVCLSNARVEINTNWNAPQALIYLEPGATAATKSVGIVLDNLSLGTNGANGVTGNFVVYRDTIDASDKIENVRVRNVTFNDSTDWTFFGGQLGASQVNPTLADKDAGYIVGDVLSVDKFKHLGTTVGFYGTAPIAQAVLATGVAHSVDDVITALQNLGLVKQS